MRKILSLFLMIQLSAFPSGDSTPIYFISGEYDENSRVEFERPEVNPEVVFDNINELSEGISTDLMTVEEVTVKLKELKSQLAAELGRSPYDSESIDWAMEVMGTRNFESREVIVSAAGHAALVGASVISLGLGIASRQGLAQSQLGAIIGFMGLGTFIVSAGTMLVQIAPIVLTSSEAYELYEEIAELENELQVLAHNLGEQQSLYEIYSQL